MLPRNPHAEGENALSQSEGFRGRFSGQRTRRDVLHPVILDVCRYPEWRLTAHVARWLRMRQGERGRRASVTALL